MNEKDLQKALKKGKKAERELKSACEDMATIFEPYFDCEIDVLHQLGDGFVILYNTDINGNNSNLNDPVIDAFENLKININHYR